DAVDHGPARTYGRRQRRDRGRDGGLSFEISTIAHSQRDRSHLLFHNGRDSRVDHADLLVLYAVLQWGRVHRLLARVAGRGRVLRARGRVRRGLRPDQGDGRSSAVPATARPVLVDDAGSKAPGHFVYAQGLLPL